MRPRKYESQGEGIIEGISDQSSARRIQVENARALTHLHRQPGAFVFAALTCLVSLAGCDALRPFEQVCERKLEAASFRVIAAPMQHELDLTQSAAQLGARGAAAAGRLILGITSAQMKSTVSAAGNAITAPFSRRYCVRCGRQPESVLFQPE